MESTSLTLPTADDFTSLLTPPEPSHWGGFYFHHEAEAINWPDHTTDLPQHQAFIAPSGDQSHHINVKETKAVAVAFRIWAPRWEHHSVTIHTDNNAALSNVDKETGRGPANAHVRTIVALAASFNITIAAVRVSSINNGLADALSRRQFDLIASICPHWDTSSFEVANGDGNGWRPGSCGRQAR
jgi:hypothetical protein